MILTYLTSSFSTSSSKTSIDAEDGPGSGDPLTGLGVAVLDAAVAVIPLMSGKIPVTFKASVTYKNKIYKNNVR